MAYLPDLSEYNYVAEFVRPATRAIGWLEKGHDFPTAPSEEAVLRTLWKFCKTSVGHTRGIHPCPFCRTQAGMEAKRGDESLLLGTAEIRVFSQEGQVFAAPTLIYHYMADHHYRPPTEFLNALVMGPPPDSEEYFSLLRGLNLEWARTPTGGQGYWDPKTYDPQLDDQTPLIELMARSKAK
jgi:hypothetical protein